MAYTDKRDFLKHRTVKTNKKIRRFGVVMTPLSRNDTNKMTGDTIRETGDAIRVVLPFKDQISADTVREQLKDLNLEIHTTIQPVCM